MGSRCPVEEEEEEGGEGPDGDEGEPMVVGDSGLLPGRLVVLVLVLMLVVPAAEVVVLMVVGVAVVSEVADRRKPRSASFWGVSSLGNLGRNSWRCITVLESADAMGLVMSVVVCSVEKC